MQQADEHVDVLVAGSGPAGATTALLLARAGLRVTLIEKAVFPRFQIGESFLATNLTWIEKLGLLPALRRLPHMVKLGGEFAMGDTARPSAFRFNTGLIGGVNETFNIARADFDNMLLEQARAAGVNILQPATIRTIERLADDDVAVVTDDGRRRTARYLVDATGHATLLGRHLGIRRMLSDQHLRKVAYFNHFEGVWRLPGDMAGFPTIAMCQEGWFWIIPLNEKITSVGLVMDPDHAKRAGVPADRMLQWGVARCPLVAERMKHATGPATNIIRADFSYRCEPLAGPGYFLVGDAGVFLDPVFSTGVCLGMMGARQAAERLIEVLKKGRPVAAARRQYIARVTESASWFARLIKMFYNHSFREMLLQGTGPVGVHKSVLAIIAGHVFPRPPFRVRWRFRLFGWLMKLQPFVTLVPRRSMFSLFASPQPPEPPKPGTRESAAPQPTAGATDAIAASSA